MIPALENEIKFEMDTEQAFHNWCEEVQKDIPKEIPGRMDIKIVNMKHTRIGSGIPTISHNAAGVKMHFTDCEFIRFKTPLRVRLKWQCSILWDRLLSFMKGKESNG